MNYRAAFVIKYIERKVKGKLVLGQPLFYTGILPSNKKTNKVNKARF